jgi:hypothetical protein
MKFPFLDQLSNLPLILDISITSTATRGLPKSVPTGLKSLRKTFSRISCAYILSFESIYLLTPFIYRVQSGKAFLLEVESDDLQEVDLESLEANALAEKEAEGGLSGSSSSSVARRS